MKNTVVAILMLLLIVSLPITTATFIQQPTKAIPEPQSQNCFDKNGYVCTEGYYCSGTQNGRNDDGCCPQYTYYDFLTNKCLPDCVDIDKDGYGRYPNARCKWPQIDCNDEDESVYPNSNGSCNGTAVNYSGRYNNKSCIITSYIEFCNGIDDNCDGLVDNSCVNSYLDLANNSINTSLHVDGLIRYGEPGCTFDYECDPNLVCVYKDWTLNAGCCSQGELWDGQKCYRYLENEGDCNKDSDCASGLHCSISDEVFDFQKDYCCSEGTDYDIAAEKCIPCGVYSRAGDKNYCKDKKRIGCGCNEKEGNCDESSQCSLGLYCNYVGNINIFGIDINGKNNVCCPLGTLYKDGECVNSNSQISCDQAKDEQTCYQTSQQCSWDPKKSVCGEFTNKGHNEACTNDSYCCDKDNGCNPDIELECNNEGISENKQIRSAVCCYSWETQSSTSGKCTYSTDEQIDTDKDGFFDDLELRYGSNPTNEKDTPPLRLTSDYCGNYFQPPFTNSDDLTSEIPSVILDTILSLSLIPSPSILLNDVSAVPASTTGKITGFMSGIVFGLVDDVSIFLMIAEFAKFVVTKLAEILESNKNSKHNTSTQDNQKYEYAGVQKGMMEVVGEFFTKIVTSILDTISKRAAIFDTFPKECDKIVLVKTFTKAYVGGYIIEQIFLLKGAATILKGTKIGEFLHFIDYTNELVGKTIMYIPAKFGKGVYRLLDSLVKKGIVRTGTEFSQNVIFGLSQIVKNVGVRDTEKLITGLNEHEIAEIGKRIDLLSGSLEGNELDTFLKSWVGKKTLRISWPESAQLALAKAINEKGRFYFNDLFSGMTDADIKEFGKQLSDLTDKTANEADIILKDNNLPKTINDFEKSRSLAKIIEKDNGEVIEFISKKKVDDAMKILGAGFSTQEQSTLRKALSKLDANLGDGVIANMKNAKPEGIQEYLDLFKYAPEEEHKYLAQMFEDVFSKDIDVVGEVAYYGPKSIKNFNGIPVGASKGNILLRGESSRLGLKDPYISMNYPDLKSEDFQYYTDYADFIFDYGMPRPGTSIDIITHLEGSTLGTRFVSTTTDVSTASAKAVMNPEGYVFIIKPKPSTKIIYAKDVIKNSIKPLDGLEGEFERTIDGGLAREEIVAAVKYENRRIVEYKSNPNYGKPLLPTYNQRVLQELSELNEESLKKISKITVGVAYEETDEIITLIKKIRLNYGGQAAEDLINSLSQGIDEGIIDGSDTSLLKLTEYLSSARASKIINPLGDIGKHQLLRLISDPRMSVRVGDETINGAVILKKGDIAENWGWQHINEERFPAAGKESHALQIKEAFGLSDSEKGVQDFIATTIPNSKAIPNPTEPRIDFIFTKDGKELLVSVSTKPESYGSITTAYPIG